jgi:hypothetical protein
MFTSLESRASIFRFRISFFDFRISAFDGLAGKVSKQPPNLALDQVSHIAEMVSAKQERIRDVPPNKSSLKIRRETTFHPRPHLHHHIHFGERHIPKAFRPILIQRDALFAQDRPCVRANLTQRARSGAESPHFPFAELIGQRLRHLAAAGVAVTNKKDLKHFQIESFIH